MSKINRHKPMFSRQLIIFIDKTTIWNLLYNQSSFLIKSKNIIEENIDILINSFINRGKVMHAMDMCIASTILKQEYG